MTTKATSTTSWKQVAEEALRQSEEKYRNLFQLSPIGVTTLDLKGVITSCNPAVYDVGGYSEDELVGRHFTKIAPVRLRDIPKFVRMFGSVVIGKIPKSFVATYNRKDGTTGWTEIRVSLLKAGSRKIGVQVLQRDITECKQAEDALRESERKYRSLFESMLNSFAYCKILVDENNQPIDYVHLEVNDAWERAIGLKREDVIGKKITEVIPGIKESKPDLISIYGKVALTGEETKFELYFEPLGKWFTISVYSPQKGYFVAVFEDITECQQAGDNPGKTSDEDRSKEQARLTPLQKRFIRSGFESLDDQETIELLISLCHPRKCKQLAKACIEQFGGLRGFLSASSLELQRAGLTPSCILSVRLLHELPEEVLRQKIIEKPVYKSSEEIFDYLYYSMRDLKIEVFKVIYLNKRNAIIDAVDLFEGTLDSIPIRPREIMESAIAYNAAGLIFAHNHPTGDPTPSKTDKQLTRELVFVGMVMQIKVLDHLVIGEDKYFSFADEKLIEKYEDDFLNMRIRAAFATESASTVSLK